MKNIHRDIPPVCFIDICTLQGGSAFSSDLIFLSKNCPEYCKMMQLSDTFNHYVTPSQSAELSKTSFTQKPKTTRTKLSMIWVKGFDGKRQH
jgi:hypothetical protein